MTEALRPDPSALPYRPCVGIMLIAADRRIFVGRRLDTPDAWQMPQGGIDPGETPREAGLRELEEEIGTARATVLAETVDWLCYDLPAHLVGQVWGGRYRGQRQKWLAARFDGVDADIDLNTGHPEFGAWRWVAADQLLGLAVPFKRATYEAVMREFAPLLAG